MRSDLLTRETDNKTSPTPLPPGIKLAEEKMRIETSSISQF